MVSNQIKLNSMVNKAPRRCINDDLIFLSASLMHCSITQNYNHSIRRLLVLSGARFDDDKENKENLLMYHILSKRFLKKLAGP